jgi:hypothetical protein
MRGLLMPSRLVAFAFREATTLGTLMHDTDAIFGKAQTSRWPDLAKTDVFTPSKVYRKCAPGFTPRRLKTIAAGQKPVKEACSMLAPAKAVSHSQAG